MSWSQSCHASCLDVALPTVSVSPVLQVEAADFTRVPRSTLICGWFSASPEHLASPPSPVRLCQSILLPRHIEYNPLSPILYPASSSAWERRPQPFHTLRRSGVVGLFFFFFFLLGTSSGGVEEGRMRGGSACWVSGRPVVHAGGHLRSLQWGSRKSKVACHPEVGGGWQPATSWMAGNLRILLVPETRSQTSLCWSTPALAHPLSSLVTHSFRFSLWLTPFKRIRRYSHGGGSLL